MNLSLTPAQYHVLRSIDHKSKWKLYLKKGTFEFRNISLQAHYPVHKATGKSLYDRGFIRGTHYMTITEMGKRALAESQREEQGWR